MCLLLAKAIFSVVVPGHFSSKVSKKIWKKKVTKIKSKIERRFSSFYILFCNKLQKIDRSFRKKRCKIKKIF